MTLEISQPVGQARLASGLRFRLLRRRTHRPSGCPKQFHLTPLRRHDESSAGSTDSVLFPCPVITRPAEAGQLKVKIRGIQSKNQGSAVGFRRVGLSFIWNSHRDAHMIPADSERRVLSEQLQLRSIELPHVRQGNEMSDRARGVLDHAARKNGVVTAFRW